VDDPPALSTAGFNYLTVNIAIRFRFDACFGAAVRIFQTGKLETRPVMFPLWNMKWANKKNDYLTALYRYAEVN